MIPKICTFRRTSVAALLVAVVIAGAAGAASEPAAVVTKLADDVIAVLKQDGLSTAEKRERLEGMVLASVDFDTLSRLVMARNWARLSEAQQQEFKREFKRHLSATYGRRIDTYRNETVQILGTREEARGDRTVKSRINRGGGIEDVLVDYRLRQRDGEWKIIDFIIEGVSLVANFRSQFPRTRRPIERRFGQRGRQAFYCGEACLGFERRGCKGGFPIGGGARAFSRCSAPACRSCLDVGWLDKRSKARRG
jgi:phospholipid transport system substrate-binding protein